MAEYYFDEKAREYVITSQGNSMRLTERDFADIRKRRLSGMLFVLRKKANP